MGVIEDLAGEARKPKKQPLWDEVAKSKGPIPGTHGYKPLPVPGRDSRGAGGGSFIEELNRLTPYTTPYEVTAAREPAKPPSTTAAETAVSADYPQADAARTAAVVKQADAPPEKRPPTLKTRQLTWEEYNKLTDDQRAAVDFNTMLIQAREKDLNTDYAEFEGGGANQEYQEAVERMFGTRGSTETYAPETMAVLKSIDYEAASGEALEDFLSLDAAISAKELKGFDTAPDPIQGGLASYGLDQAIKPEEKAAASTAHLERVLAKSGQLIQNFRASTAAARSGLAVRYGGVANKATPALGFGEDEDSSFFRQGIVALSMDLSPEETALVWDDLQKQLTPEKMRAFLKFADDITRDSLEIRPPQWTQDEKVIFNPQLIRERLGFDRGGRDAR